MGAQSAHGGRITRRTLLAGGLGAAAATGLGGSVLGPRGALAKSLRPGPEVLRPDAWQREALRVLGRTSMRGPDSLPHAGMAAGTDTLPQIEHVVVLMMENHSYDNFFGMLGRGRHEKRRGDGYTLGSDGLPTATNPYADGTLQRAFRMPTTCQFDGTPSQEWEASHNAYDNGRNDGFVRTPISVASADTVGAVAMGYWQREDLPFTYDLATQFPIGDRWFCSLLGQTDPNRRYLIAATSTGMTDDIGASPGPDAGLVLPANGTIFQRLSDAGISWADYYTSFPTGATMELYPDNDAVYSETNAKPIAQFYTAAAAGTLPQFSLLDPNYGTQSQENPQNIVVGEAFLEGVVKAIGASPKWRQTVLIITYDEHGGYFDHVPPPVALAPDDIPPTVQPGESTYDGFKRYGFRVPSVVVGPYAKPGHVSHVVYDHTSVLAFVERKWNLPALTLRDANANDLTDFLDLSALQAGNPTFPELPALAASGDDARTLECSKTGPGTVPPPPPAIAPVLTLRDHGIDRRRHGIVIALRTNGGALHGVELELHHGKHRIARRRIGTVGARTRDAVLRVHGRAPAPGHYTVLAKRGGKTLARRSIRVR